MQFFDWQPSKETLVAFITGITVIFLSVLMLPFDVNSWLRIAIHDIGMICLVGILLPLLYIQRSGLSFTDFGLTLRKWYIFVPINLGLGALLLSIFIYWVPPNGMEFDFNTLMTISVILCTGVFEVIFFYGFLRTVFEKAFGMIPAILLTGVFYSFHHIGFQPEFLRLFFVGVMYALIYRTGNSVLLIYPFFWGVGAVYDVLIQSREVSAIMYPGIRSLYLFVLIMFILIRVWIQSRRN